MLWLKSLFNCPPAEFYFKQSEAGTRTFGPSPLIGQVVADLSNFRKGNNLPRSKARECLQDVIQFTVNRLDPNSEWVIETNQTAEELTPEPSNGSCAGCGALVT